MQDITINAFNRGIKMSYDNQGAIWKNQDKTKPSHPDFRGNATVNGEEYWVSAWKRDPDGNSKAPALRFFLNKKEEEHKKGIKEVEKAISEPSENIEDDNIPF